MGKRLKSGHRKFVVTEEMVRDALRAGACRSSLSRIKAGVSVFDLDESDVWWFSQRCHDTSRLLVKDLIHAIRNVLACDIEAAQDTDQIFEIILGVRRSKDDDGYGETFDSGRGSGGGDAASGDYTGRRMFQSHNSVGTMDDNPGISNGQGNTRCRWQMFFVGSGRSSVRAGLVSKAFPPGG